MHPSVSYFMKIKQVDELVLTNCDDVCFGKYEENRKRGRSNKRYINICVAGK